MNHQNLIEIFQTKVFFSATIWPMERKLFWSKVKYQKFHIITIKLDSFKTCLFEVKR